MAKIRLEESPIAFQVIGAGPVLVLLHGFGGSHTHWEKLVPELCLHYRLIIPHLGPLTLGAVQLSFSEQVDLLEDFMRAIYKQFGKFSLVGISYGGALAWAMAAKDQDQIVERLFMINPMPPNPQKTISSRSLRRLMCFGRWAWALAIYLLTPVAHWDFHNVALDIRVDWPMRVPTLRKIFSRRQKMLFHLISRFAWVVQNENWGLWEKQLKNIAVPTFIVHGEEDRIFSHKTMKELKNKFSQATLLVLKGATHMAILSHPKDMALLLCDIMVPDKSQKVSSS